MSIQRRLSKLEPSAQAEHTRAWKHFWELFHERVDPVIDQALRLPLFEVHIMSDEPAYDWTLPEPALEEWVVEFSKWCALADRFTPEPDTVPNLNLWPDAIPMPPDEPPGIWAILERYFDDPSEPTSQLCAALLLSSLATARATVDFLHTHLNRKC